MKKLKKIEESAISVRTNKGKVERKFNKKAIS